MTLTGRTDPVITVTPELILWGELEVMDARAFPELLAAWLSGDPVILAGQRVNVFELKFAMNSGRRTVKVAFNPAPGGPNG